MSDIFDRIKPYDMNRDFVFVSYSKKDKDIVYPLIENLQKMGCNIWIDKELKTTAGTSWQDSALEAIANEKCIAILFMASKNSLTSAPVFAELVWSQQGNEVRDNSPSDEPKRIIPVNVDEDWVPSKKGLHDWIWDEMRTIKDLLTNSDLNCLDSDIGDTIRAYKNRKGSFTKGSIATTLYREVFKPLGGDNITFVNADDIQTILDNVKSSVLETNCTATSCEQKSETAEDREPEGAEISVNSAPEARSCAEPNDSAEDMDVDASETAELDETADHKKKKSVTLTGDVTYTLYGKEYTENQSTMMLRIFAQVLKRHEEIVPTLCRYKGMNCVSKTNYELEENREDMPSYFRGCKNFEYSTGSICVGTAYSFQDKCKKIALLLHICGESHDILVSDQIELPVIKTKLVLSDENTNTAARGNELTFTVYNERFTTNQSDMMKIICKKILEKHPEKLELAAEKTSFISLTDYRDIPREKRPVYFRALSVCEINGRLVSVGTTFNKQTKLLEIGRLLEVCGENGSVTIEGETISARKKERSSTLNVTDFFD